MKAKVYDYFINLEEQGLPMKGRYILDAGPRIDQPNECRFYANIHKHVINNTTFYEKEIFDPIETIASIASAEMYNAVGIMTPPIYLMKTPLANPKLFKRHSISGIQQDVTSLKDFICSRGGDDQKYFKGTQRHRYKNKKKT